ncbi:L,D-transpeptidase [Carboxylicivirga caseinilyticus]|uniref:L,D-transpeptidase n=1 Tax=Carboxylicivirga caseinilyticus TaxID=3417572 RepID=UPI003D357EAF|nr:L,D-transpeptidase [Marinilabiliaceae bacterium A049]
MKTNKPLNLKLLKNIHNSITLSKYNRLIFYTISRHTKQYNLYILSLVLLILIPLSIRGIVWMTITNNNKTLQVEEIQLTSVKQMLTKEILMLDKKLANKKPKSNYLVINSSSNIFRLYKNNELVKEDKCSTGSYILLKNGEDQQWMFKTPKGEFKILGKTTSPVWKKPDWAFIEEGLPVPSLNHHSRYESGVLGDYALSLGNGYLIHGTLYQRFLGLPVTHGCIRLNDENLELVYRSLTTGSRVYIY